MGQTLTNGVYLPDEGERNCYTGLARNWRAVDNHLGSTDIHVTINDKQAWDGHIADTTIHVTSADKQAWNGHVADTTIHVTSADKQAWNGHVADTVKHVTASDKTTWNGHVADTDKHVTASDKTTWNTVTSKANDSDVVHKSGNETVAGIKTFSSIIPVDGTYLGNESSTNERTNLCLRSNRDTADKSGAYISRFRSNKNQGELLGSDNSFISISFLENETRYTRCFDFGLTDWNSDGIPQTYYLTSPNSKGALGTSSRKWQKINGIEPSSLSLPSGNTSDRLDISSYITAFDGSSNSYTPPVNGWISISVNNSTEVYVFLNNLWGVNNSRPTAGDIRVMIPVLKDVVVAIRITGGTLNFASFIPCQGNI